jgi:hypothetical protein
MKKIFEKVIGFINAIASINYEKYYRMCAEAIGLLSIIFFALFFCCVIIIGFAEVIVPLMAKFFFLKLMLIAFMILCAKIYLDKEIE